jgi:hypothetical protein
MEPKRRALRPIALHARHGDARRLPVNLDENRIRKELVEFHKGNHGFLNGNSPPTNND